MQCNHDHRSWAGLEGRKSKGGERRRAAPGSRTQVPIRVAVAVASVTVFTLIVCLAREERSRSHLQRCTSKRNRVINGPLERMYVWLAPYRHRRPSLFLPSLRPSRPPRCERDANTRHYHLLQSIIKPTDRDTLSLIACLGG